MLRQVLALRMVIKMWHKSRIMRLLVLCVTAWLMAAVAFWLFESKASDAAFGSLGQTMTETLVLLITGGFLEAPTTTGGMTAALVTCLFSIIFVALLTAEVAALFVESRLFKRGERRVNISNHVIVCNAGPSLDTVIRELTSKDHAQQQKIVVICQDEPACAAHDAVHWIGGDATDDEVLNRACVATARAAIVLASDRNDPVASDSRNILAALAVESANPRVHTCVELIDPANRKHLRHAGVDETICAGEIASKLAVQTVLNPGLSRMLVDLMSFDENEELYRVEVPEEYGGLSFGEALARFYGEHRAVLVAIEREGHHIMAPTDEVSLAADDVVFLVANRFPPGLKPAG